ncbi:PadR family transcriptional regulator [Occallatibacter riparius]|uniref:PadR family transcriptional regulator n=1 Tax=Occallatibacter riparius TaxID=1002689 RepID=A0A9J7BNW9_9BACT|nr:PadR family transcriptional regulator [Occallatibacter riparius]UWZ84580.1 PadR family transcriptional regulator [Occallatibacter riparius]
MAKRSSAKYQDLYIGLVRLHVLHHAAKESVFGQGMIEELGRHGYRLGPGTIYPLLHSMERRGWLRAQLVVVAGRRRKSYVATHAGKAALTEAIARVEELVHEVAKSDGEAHT